MDKLKNKYTIFIIFFLIIFPICVEAYTPLPNSPLAKNEHPRVFMNPTTLQTIATRATTTHATMYANLKLRADELLTDPLEIGSYSVTVFERTAILALVVLIEKTNGNSYTNYRDKAFEYAQYVLDNTDPWDLTSKYSGQSYNIRGRAGALSLVYDWLYYDLPSTLKSDIHNFLVNVYKGLHNIDRPSGVGQIRRSVYGSNYWLEWGAHPWFSVALYGDGEGDESIVNDALDDTKNEVDNYMIPALNMLGGALHNGWGYQLGGGDMAYSFFNLRAWQTATNETVFTDLFALKEYPKYFLYASKPDGALIKINDTNDEFSDPNYPYGTAKYGKAHARTVLILLMDIYNDGYAKYIVDKQDFRYSGNSADRGWRNLLFYDDTVSEELPSTLPFVRFFPQTGILFGRSDWGPDALYYTFRNRDQYGNHSDAKQNSFTIFYKGAPLAINDGNYPSGASGAQSTKSYYRRTISSNSMLVFDPIETFYNYKVVYNDGGQKFGDNQKGANGGYQSFNNNDYNQVDFDASENNTADNIFEDSTDYTYIKGDATRGYTSKVSHFTREFIHLKPDYFVVYDRVSSTNESFRKGFLLHSITEPVLNGAEDFNCPDTFSTTGERACQGDTNAGISKSYDSDLVEITNGNGKLFSKTFLPSNPVIRKVGGQGYMFWIDDANQDIPPKYYTSSVTGGWRLEISPSTSALNDTFLHVLYPTDSTTQSMPSTTLITADTMVGALINDPQTPRIVLFSKDPQGVSVSSATYTANYSSSLTGKHLLVDMEPGIYDVYKNGVKILIGVTASSQGVLTFNSAGGSTFQIVQTGSILTGDVTGNGIVDILDLQACVNVFLGTETDPGFVARADVNKDTKVDVLDVQAIVNLILSGV